MTSDEKERLQMILRRFVSLNTEYDFKQRSSLYGLIDRIFDKPEEKAGEFKVETRVFGGLFDPKIEAFRYKELKPEMTAKELVERLESYCSIPTATYSWSLEAIKKEAGL